MIGHKVQMERCPAGVLFLLVVVSLVLLNGAGTQMRAEQNSTEKRAEKQGIVLTIVFDNYAGRKGLTPSWGFGCVVQGLSKTMLFDTGGKADVLLHNMKELGIKPGEIDVVVLSHHHGDHVGGLSGFLQKNRNVTVYYPATFPEYLKKRFRKAAAKVVETKDAQQICPGVGTIGVLGGGVPEQGIYLETADGIVVITGCAHPGVVNITRAAKSVSAKPVHAVLGGFHMGGFKAERIATVIKDLKDLGVQRAGPCHCSGDQTRKMMAAAFGKDYINLHVGSRLEFPKPEMDTP